MNIQQMAAEMNVDESNLKSFIGCLRVWTDKGYSIEYAIKKHQDIMNRWAASPQGVVNMVKQDIMANHEKVD